MFETGDLCVKIAGREAGKVCVVIKRVDKNFVIIDGDVRRRKCNVDHLIPLNRKLDIKETSKTEEIQKLLIKEGLMEERRKREEKKEKSPRPKKQHKVKKQSNDKVEKKV